MQKLANLNIKYLKGVGEARHKLLSSELGIETFRDLIYTFPFKYADRSKFWKINELSGDMPAVQIKGEFVRFHYEGEGAKLRLIGLFSDGTNLIEILWFRRTKKIIDLYPIGTTFVVFGKPTLFKERHSFVHPEIEIYNPATPPCGLRGIYSLTEKLRSKNFTSRAMQNLMINLFNKVPDIQETLPSEITGKLHLTPLRQALSDIHNPSSLSTLRKAEERLKFEELFYLQMHILRYSNSRTAKYRGFIFHNIGKAFNTFFHEVLPFQLTDAQKRVIREIRNDMLTGRQMNRLLQGDVGSGKTLVAFMSMLIAIDNNCQASLMAPTEILAKQHFETIRLWAEPLGLKIALLTGNTKNRERIQIHSSLTDGSLNILIGTHALIEDSVKFHNLGIAIIDEQHRFGVQQRAKMWTKNETPPHILVMTATPIPRTLAMTVYGDLDISIIDQLPPGRKPIQTLLRYDDNRGNVIRAAEQQLRLGRQMYIVYPLIHENDKTSLKSLEEGLKNICETFPDYNVCCVHGQMHPDDKERQMNRFVSGEAQIMVSTTVIEVGVNVPNASVMIIENAERFGLSQLHQLRGRVGRGAEQSWCILMSNRKIGADTRKRLEIMTQSSDGFVISEADMQMRGPGDIEGTQQSGLAFNLQIANLATDGQIVQLARDTANEIYDKNPSLIAYLNNPTNLIDNSAETSSLSDQSKLLIKKELLIRFAHSVNWSQIS